jgi:hypothetical protein
MEKAIFLSQNCPPSCDIVSGHTQKIQTLSSPIKAHATSAIKNHICSMMPNQKTKGLRCSGCHRFVCIFGNRATPLSPILIIATSFIAATPLHQNSFGQSRPRHEYDSDIVNCKTAAKNVIPKTNNLPTVPTTVPLPLWLHSQSLHPFTAFPKQLQSNMVG